MPTGSAAYQFQPTNLQQIFKVYTVKNAVQRKYSIQDYGTLVMGHENILLKHYFLYLSFYIILVSKIVITNQI